MIHRNAFRFAAVVLLAAVCLGARPATGSAPERRVALPEGTVLGGGARPVFSLDSSIGFVAPASGDTLASFAVGSGEVLGSLSGHGAAIGLAISETPGRRLLAVTCANDPTNALASSVVVVDATDAADLRVVSVFMLPDTVRLPASGARAEILASQRFGVVPVASPVGAVVTFDVESGQQAGAITLDCAPTRIALGEGGAHAFVAAVCAAADEVAILSVGEYGELMPVSSFAPPGDAPLGASNDVAFDAVAAHAFVASEGGRALYSFAPETGELVSSVALGGPAGALAIYHGAARDVLAVAVAPPGSADTAKGAGVAFVAADGAGRLAEISRFSPESGDDMGLAVPADFSADGRLAYVAAANGALYVVRVKNGTARRIEVGDRVHAIAAAPLAEVVAVVRGTAAGDTLDLFAVGSDGPEIAEPAAGASAAKAPAADAPPAPSVGPALPAPPTAANSSALRVAPAVVERGRLVPLAVTVFGTNLRPGSVVTVAGTSFAVEVAAGGSRAVVSLPRELFAASGTVSLVVKSADGEDAGAAEIHVVEPAAPAVASVTPSAIAAGSGGLDLQIAGDHFREGAVVTLTYADGQELRTARLRTYRLGFTRIVACMPARLAARARVYELTVVDRDGLSTSDAVAFAVTRASTRRAAGRARD